jgi:FHS family L-fucose permease-like MFS transporter
MTSLKLSVNFNDNTYPQHSFTLIVLCFLFFLWGVIVCLNNILIPHLKNIFSLSYSQAMLVQFCFFSAYFLISIPAGAIIQRVGYKAGIVTGLILASIGCLCFYPSAELQSYPMFLFSLFILASGVTFLQVAANPFITLLGPSSTAAVRLTIAQACNSIGTTIAPFIGGYFIFSQLVSPANTTQNVTTAEFANITLQNTQLVQTPYLVLAVILILFAVFVSTTTFSDVGKELIEDNLPAKVSEVTHVNINMLFHNRKLLLGAVAIFCYVGAEVAIGSFLVTFISQENIGNISLNEAAFYVPFYWGGALVGRLLGALFMPYFTTNKILTFNSAIAATLIFITIFSSGYTSMITVLLIGLFNSIMFPTIFSLALDGLGKLTVQGSSILCLSIVGGAVIPTLQGVLADLFTIQSAFILPALCYLYVMFFAITTLSNQTISKQITK